MKKVEQDPASSGCTEHARSARRAGERPKDGLLALSVGVGLEVLAEMMRWTAAGMLEAEQQFHKSIGYATSSSSPSPSNATS